MYINNYDYYDKAKNLCKFNKNNVIGYISYNFIESDDYVCFIERSQLSLNSNKYYITNPYSSTTQSLHSTSDFIIIGKEVYEKDNVISEIQKYLKYSV